MLKYGIFSTSVFAGWIAADYQINKIAPDQYRNDEKLELLSQEIQSELSETKFQWAKNLTMSTNIDLR